MSMLWPTDAAACLIGISLGFAFTPMDLRPIAMAPDDTMRTSLPSALSLPTCSATESMNPLDTAYPAPMIEDDPILTTTRVASLSASLRSIALPRKDTSHGRGRG